MDNGKNSTDAMDILSHHEPQLCSTISDHPRVNSSVNIKPVIESSYESTCINVDPCEDSCVGKTGEETKLD